jgi:predicted amidohydrolase
MAPNLEAAAEAVREAAASGADFVLTPENTPILEPDHARLLAAVPTAGAHPALQAFSEMAKALNIWLLLGSTAVKLDGEDRLANRSVLFRPDGGVAAQYDKIHMFDVNVPDGQSYRESKTFRPGGRAVAADLPGGRVGLTICYDLRFPALYRSLAKAGASVLTVPAAFTQFTGEAHWHTLLRARAIETGCFVLAPGQCGEHAEGRRTYGHSLAVAPWGEVLADGGGSPGVTTVEIDLDKIAQARGWVPAITHDREFAAPDVD